MSSIRLLAAVLSLLPALVAAGAGLLAPRDQSLPPLRVTDHLVDVEIDDGVARTTVTQTFRNDTGRRLEATYLFPLPEEADLTKFEMTFNGKMVTGRVLPAKEAAQIYESIVRQSKDPGLIEFIGRRLLQMRVFPIEPNSDTTIRLNYQQICRRVSGMQAYHYPLRTRKTSGQAYGTVRFAVNLETATPLKGIWSPTHAVEVVRQGEQRAKVAYEATGGSLEDDFLLLYGTDSSDLGLSLVSYQPNSSEPGHFVLMLTPKQMWPEDEREPQDVVFVVDTSGSMAGDKIEQARRSVKYCIDRLDERDRFSVVRFSTGFDSLFESLRPASDENRAAARAWVEKFRPAGGTNIADTLQHVLAMRPEKSTRSFVTVFLTDGRGNRSPEEIMNTIAGAEGASVRMFPFGVGHDVNTKLLDRLGETYAGRTTYVQPGENLELVLGDFFSVISRPVLTDLRLALPGVGATERFPATLGDLYHGQQLILAGKFDTSATGAVRLTGRRGGETVEFIWPDVAFRSEPSADYVPSVWAGRKIAYLIDQIRMHGESSEMVEEILALSQTYGIQTPYSSWLVDPERTRPTSLGITIAPIRGEFSGAPPAAQARRLREIAGEGITGGRRAPGAGGGSGGGDTDLLRSGGRVADRFGDEDGAIDAALAGAAVTQESGEAANVIARKNAALKSVSSMDRERLSQAAFARQRWGDRWYNRLGGLLVDEAFDEDFEIQMVRFASDAYFDLVRARPDLRAVLAASREAVVIVNEGWAVLVSDRVGVEAFSDEERKHLDLTVR